MDSEGNIKIKGTLMLEEFIKYNELYIKKRLQKRIALIFILFLVVCKVIFNGISGWTFIIVTTLISSGFIYLYLKWFYLELRKILIVIHY